MIAALILATLSPCEFAVHSTLGGDDCILTVKDSLAIVTALGGCDECWESDGYPLVVLSNGDLMDPMPWAFGQSDDCSNLRFSSFDVGLGDDCSDLDVFCWE